MTARSLGDVLARVQATAGVQRTFQPVRRNSYNVGEREQHLWRPIDPTEINARVQAAQWFDRKYKGDGRRNGALGHVGIEVLEALLRIADYKTGRLEPSIDWICRTIRRSRAAVVRAMARLKLHGFLSWIRRTEPTGNDGAGPQVRQIPNAYVFGLPKEVVGWVARKLGRKPKDAVEATERVVGARASWLRTKPSAGLDHATLTKLRARAAERSSASSPRRQNPAAGSKR